MVILGADDIIIAVFQDPVAPGSFFFVPAVVGWIKIITYVRSDIAPSLISDYPVRVWAVWDADAQNIPGQAVDCPSTR